MRAFNRDIAVRAFEHLSHLAFDDPRRHPLLSALRHAFPFFHATFPFRTVLLPLDGPEASGPQYVRFEGTYLRACLRQAFHVGFGWKRLAHDAVARILDLVGWRYGQHETARIVCEI